MNVKNLLVVSLAALLVTSFAIAQEMNKEQWQQEINKYTQMKTDLQTQQKTLTDDIAAAQAKSAKLDEDYKKCMDELYALVGSDKDKAAAFEMASNYLFDAEDGRMLHRRSQT